MYVAETEVCSKCQTKDGADLYRLKGFVENQEYEKKPLPPEVSHLSRFLVQNHLFHNEESRTIVFVFVSFSQNINSQKCFSMLYYKIKRGMEKILFRTEVGFNRERGIKMEKLFIVIFSFASMTNYHFMLFFAVPELFKFAW